MAEQNVQETEGTHSPSVEVRVFCFKSQVMSSPLRWQESRFLSSQAIGRKAMDIASDLCVYTNKNYVCETVQIPVSPEAAAAEVEVASEAAPTKLQ